MTKEGFSVSKVKNKVYNKNPNLQGSQELNATEAVKA